MKNIFVLFSILLTVFTLSSCSKDDVQPENPFLNKVKIAELKTSSQETLRLWADNDLSIGYQPLYIQVLKNEEALSNKQVSLSPVMQMATMSHGCPHSPTLSYDPASRSYVGFAVFTMASGTAGTWKLDVEVNGEKLSFPVTIAMAKEGNNPVKTFTATDGTRYVIALQSLRNPKVGMNDLDVLLFKRESMFSFPAADGFTMTFHPEMTSMNHGSPNNVNPVGKGNGKYSGKVNFTMTGDWRLFFDIKKDNTLISSNLYLDILF